MSCFSRYTTLVYFMNYFRIYRIRDKCNLAVLVHSWNLKSLMWFSKNTTKHYSSCEFSDLKLWELGNYCDRRLEGCFTVNIPKINVLNYILHSFQLTIVFGLRILLEISYFLVHAMVTHFHAVLILKMFYFCTYLKLQSILVKSIAYTDLSIFSRQLIKLVRKYSI